MFIDKLTKNLINDAIQWDRKENLSKPPKDRTSQHIDELVNAISSCGISFTVWEKRDGDGKSSGVYDFTSLMGSDKKLLLKKLPDKLGPVIRPGCSQVVVKLWKVCLSHYSNSIWHFIRCTFNAFNCFLQDFADLYMMLTTPDPTSVQITKYFEKVCYQKHLLNLLNIESFPSH